MILLLLWACTGQDPVATALAPPASNPREALAACEAVAFPELQWTCRVEAAARAAGAGDDETAGLACAAIPEGTWRNECHFRAGEEQARRGDGVTALGHCVQAGSFGRYCLTHAGWGFPPLPDLDSSSGPRVGPAMEGILAAVEARLEGAPDGLEGEGRDIFRSRLWFNLYYGTGVAHPAPARAAPPEQGPFARGAWALEAVRLALAPGAPAPPDLVQVMSGMYHSDTGPTPGTSLDPRLRHGRYNSPIPVPQENQVPRVPVYGGGLRIVGETEEEDLAIAVLEALYFRPDTPADTFLPYVDDPRPRVRMTAARLLRLCAPAALDMESTLKALLEHPDPAVRWNAQEALEHKTWIRQLGGYQ